MIPVPYIRDSKRCAFTPIFVPGEQYQFYINFNDPVSDPASGDFRLQLYNYKNELIDADAGTIKTDVVKLDFYNLIISLDFPAAASGQYYFLIRDIVADVIKATSNYIYVENDPEIYSIITSYVAWRHKYNMDGIRYESNPNYYNLMRLPIVQVDFQFENEVKQYRNVTDRKLRNTKSYKDEVVKLETYYLDIEGHKAASHLFDHDTIFINGINVTAKSSYVRDNGTGNQKLTKGFVDAIIDDTIQLPESIATDTYYWIDSNGDRIIDGDDIRIRHT